MSDTDSWEKGSSSENKDPVNHKNATEHVKKPYDHSNIIPITEGHGESLRKKRP